MDLSEAMKKYGIDAKTVLKKVKAGELTGLSPRNKTNTTGKWNIQEVIKKQLDAVPVQPQPVPPAPVTVVSTPAVPASNLIKKEVNKNDPEKRPERPVKTRTQTPQRNTDRQTAAPRDPEPPVVKPVDTTGGFFWW